MKIRKLGGREAHQKKQERNQLIAGTVLIVIMVLGTLGYAIKQEQQEKSVYNGFIFIRGDAGWMLQKQPFLLTTKYAPKELADVSVSGFFSPGDLLQFQGKNVYYSAFSNNERFAAGEIFSNLNVLRAQPVCFEEDANRTECADLPLKTCGNDAVIVIKESRKINVSEGAVHPVQNPNLRRDSKCIIIEADADTLVKASDRFLFSLYGIMK